LKKLFSENINPQSRQQSAIVNAFYKKAENHRKSSEEEFNEQELIDFINDNEIGILAPYLYDNFDPESITELTVSWWTEDKEIEELQKNPDWDGETPGFKLSLNEDGNFIQFRTSEPNFFENELIYANDEYAYENPTVVFGSFNDDEMIVDPGDIWYGGGGNPTPQPTTHLPHEIGVNCQNFDFNRESLRYRMPDFKMTGNTRPYPHANKFTLWVANGQYSFGTQTSINLNQLAYEKKFSRCTGDDCKWQTNFFPVLVTNWAESSSNIQIIMAYRKRYNSVKQTVQVGVTNSSSGETTTISHGLEATASRHKLIFSQTWGKCTELLGQYKVDQQNGLND